ncbi:acyl carrier protein [Streptomyces sp. NPDC049687]|uniref:acyl carrier protein n=1 Tax=Streptomyces sp. NPDC049687 TaxID=3365596 RepID=UPI0037A4E552
MDTVETTAGGGDEAAFFEIVARVLRRPRVRPDDDYFELGGTSLGVMQIVWMVEERLGVRISLTDFFDSPDLAGIARLVTDGRSTDRARAGDQ